MAPSGGPGRVPIPIDGSLGEGGGQVLRTALTLSMCTGRPFHMEKVRAGREKPGLQRQHIASVNAAAQICGAGVEGVSLGSTTVSFTPGEVKSGEYHFAVGTAGSATLVMQTVMPALLLVPGESALVFEGGTHNPLAPPYDFIATTYLPLIGRMGPWVDARLVRPGFYPAGGGRFEISIRPEPLKPIEIVKRGEIQSWRARAVISRLPAKVAERQLAVVSKRLGWDPSALRVVEVTDARGPGNLVMLEIKSRALTAVFTGFGERGLGAEKAAEEAVVEVLDYLSSGAPVDRHLADQLLVPFALAGGGSFVTQTLSEHTKTNVEVIRRFLDVAFAITDVTGSTVKVTVAR